MSATVEYIEKTTDQEAELLEREGRIERAQRNAYYEIGLELKMIRDNGLYKISRAKPVSGKYSFTTFEEYAQERWQYERQTVYRLIDAAEVTAKLCKMSPIGYILPSRESHVRELLRLETDAERAQVWTKVVESGETITATKINQEVEIFLANKKKNWLTIDEWEKADKKNLNFTSDKTFNKQDNASIEWAQWSWNPITGCRHDCPYCYARDIANRFYPQKFEPSIYPERFASPANTRVPDKAAQDISYRNVFAGSMADIFGRWVPSEWIDRLLLAVSDNPQWNFLFLTKFPKRMAEFEIPENAWMGTTIDCQARVKAAESAFSKIKSGIKWISAEPLLEPLTFSLLDQFDWLVIGGASQSACTPAWVPPIDWIVDLHQQARKANCAIYYKDNCGMHEDMRIKEFPWGSRSEIPAFAPDIFRYLGKQ